MKYLCYIVEAILAALIASILSFFTSMVATFWSRLSVSGKHVLEFNSLEDWSSWKDANDWLAKQPEYMAKVRVWKAYSSHGTIKSMNVGVAENPFANLQACYSDPSDAAESLYSDPEDIWGTQSVVIDTKKFSISQIAGVTRSIPMFRGLPHAVTFWLQVGKKRIRVTASGEASQPHQRSSDNPSVPSDPPTVVNKLKIVVHGGATEKDLVCLAIQESSKPDVDSIFKQIYMNRGDLWESAVTREFRPAESVVMPKGLVDEIVGDAKRFLMSKDRYARLGIPHRRGYHLVGPPGCGKTSLAEAVACELGVSLYVLSLNGVADRDIRSLLARVEPYSVIAIEDWDAIPALQKRQSSNEDSVERIFEKTSKGFETKSGLTLSGFLNSLDGPAAAASRIIFATSNNPEVLDPALIRSGRMDRTLILDHATGEQAKDLWDRFFPDAGFDGGQIMSALIDNRRLNGEFFSMADIQGYYQQHWDSPEIAVDKCAEWADEVQRQKRVLKEGLDV